MQKLVVIMLLWLQFCVDGPVFPLLDDLKTAPYVFFFLLFKFILRIVLHYINKLMLFISHPEGVLKKL